MKTIFAIVAVLFIITGFGMIHGGTQMMEYIAIGLMGTGIVYLLWLLFISREEKEKK